MDARRPSLERIHRAPADRANRIGVGDDSELETRSPGGGPELPGPTGKWSRYSPPLRFLLLTALTVFLAETLTMLLLVQLDPVMHPTVEAAVDGLLLVILISPALYLFLFRPMRREIRERQRAQADLRTINRTLEKRVAERTADLRVANEHLVRMASELTQAEEQERLRIAAGLHDLIGESLVTARLRLGMLRSAVPDAQSRQIEEVRQQLQSVIEGTRKLTFQISNPLLYEVGLEAAVESLLKRLAEDQQFEAEFRMEAAALRLADGFKVILYRVVSELLVNIVKHARAETVRVTIRTADDLLIIAVEDDGVGFVPWESGSWTEQTPGLGLFKARERISGLGGELAIDSAPGRGTRIEIRTPLWKRPDQ